MSDRVLVFEVVNYELHECYVGATELEFQSAMAAFMRQPPKEILHWNWGAQQNLGFREIEPELALNDAVRFVDLYCQSLGAGGWRIFMQALSKDPGFAH